MIASDTPPGTPLVVVWTCTDRAAYVAQTFSPAALRELDLDVLDEYWSEDGFRLGGRLVLARTSSNELAAAGFVVEVVGVEGGWAPQHFAVAALPAELTRLLTAAPRLEETVA